MIKITNLQISGDDDLLLTLNCNDTLSDEDACKYVAIHLGNDINIESVQPNTWIEGHRNFDFMLTLSPKKQLSLTFIEKNVPTGTGGKGNVLSTIPATFLRLGLISQEEYSAFNNTILNHPLVKARLKVIQDKLRKSHEDIMKNLDGEVSKIQSSLKNKH